MSKRDEMDPNVEETGKKGKKKKEKVKKSVGREILEWVLTILVAVVAALVIRSFVFEMVRVDGDSMDDTLADGEIMFVSKYEYSTTWLCTPFQSNNAKERAARITAFGNPDRLDVVICRYPVRGDVNFVKRVVGLPGDKVALTDGYLYINGEQVKEEAEIEGIKAEYRTNLYTAGHTFPEYYVPKKGDVAVIRQDATRPDGFALYLNGGEEAWNRKRTCLVLKADGKTLKVYTQNKDESSKEKDGNKLPDSKVETVISWDGKVMKPAEFIKDYPGLLDKELTVDEDYYFVMGDHRNNSRDSRSDDVGVLQRSQIIGHAKRVVYPFSNFWHGIE